MEHKIEFRLASFLYKYSFPLYKNLYNRFKLKQDAEELSFLKQSIKRGDIVLDIGSNIGFYAKIMSELVGETGKVYCFEPDKTNFGHLKNLLGEKSNVVLTNKAVADKSEKIEIFTSHRLNVDHRTYKPEKFDSSYFIDSISIDEFLGDNLKVDFIKMDIQGAEIFALKGMEKTLVKNKNLKIVTEFWPHGLKSAGSSAIEMLDFMNDQGYKSYLIGGNSFQLSAENLSSLGDSENDFHNVIFKR
ncbi:MAG: FkbM family methyltransferase [Bacteroidia bacterium]